MLFSQNISSTLQNLKEIQDAPQVFVVTDEHTRPLVTLPYPTIEIPSGEDKKTLESVEQIWDFLSTHKATRNSVLACIGGGVVCDLGGFAAATYKRGINHVLIPTTLLAMVDAAIGGKTGFNHHGVKNEIGCFYPAQEIIISTAFLKTLPIEEMLSGYAEMLKHALIANEEEWWRLMQIDPTDSWESEQTKMEERIAASIRIKESIVRQDPYDNNVRQTLNFGHTIGHALEAIAMEKGQCIRHGYAIMQGMAAAMYLSVTETGLNKEILSLFTHTMIKYYGKSTTGCENYDKLIDLMRHDKKNTSQEAIRFTLLAGVGKPMINQTVEYDKIKEAVEYVFSL